MTTLQSNTHTSEPGAALTAPARAEHDWSVIDMARLLAAPCCVALCDNPQMAKGLCWKHYSRQRKWGDVARSDKARHDVERFWMSFERSSSGCWLWTGRINPQGYGVFDYGRQAKPAHRWSYETLVAPVLPTDDVHHTCHKRACVNPSHLQSIDATAHRRMHNRELWAIRDPEELRAIKALLAQGIPVAKLARQLGYERTVIRSVVRGTYDALLEEGAS